MRSPWRGNPLRPKAVLHLTGVLPHREARAAHSAPVIETRPAPTQFSAPQPPSIYPEDDWRVSAPDEAAMHHLCRVPGGLANRNGQVFDERGFWLRAASHKWRPRAKGSTRVSPGRPFPRYRRVRGTVAVLTASTQHYYFHWLFDVLPRIHLLEEAGCEVAAIFVDERLPFQRESLSILGAGWERLAAADHALLGADELLVPCHQIASGHGIPRWVLSFLRGRFLPAASRPHGEHPRRFYATRKNAGHRRVTNDDALRPVFERHGIRAVALEELGMAEQIALFADAEMVVAPHGGGLSNLVFCAPGTAVVELQSACPQDLYYRVSAALGLNYTYARAPRGETARLTLDDYAIDPEELDRAISCVRSVSRGESNSESSSSAWSAKA